MADLKYRFRSPEILQPVRTERLYARERRQVVATEIVRRLGEKRLTAVTSREKARDTVERRAEIVAVAHFDRAGVKRHAHAQLRSFGPRLAMERALRFECRGKSVGRRVERRAEGVPARLEDVAVVIVDAVAQQRIVARERSAHRIGVRFPQPRAALDVGEEQRDGAGRNVCHRGSPPRGTDSANDTRLRRQRPPDRFGRSRLPRADESAEGVAWPALHPRREPA